MQVLSCGGLEHSILAISLRYYLPRNLAFLGIELRAPPTEESTVLLRIPSTCFFDAGFVI